MGGTILGNCDYCERKIDRDPMLDGMQYCDSCQTHFDLFNSVKILLLDLTKEDQYGYHEKSTSRVAKAIEKFSITL